MQRYHTRNLIGQGGLAQVYRAWRSLADGTAHVVALKKLRPEHEDNPDLYQRFAQEGARAIWLAHPSLVKVWDFDCDEHGKPCLVMELVDGTSLAVILTHASLSPPEIRRIALSMLDALAYLHGQGLGHGDISSGNVLVSLTGEIKLTDFTLTSQLHSRRSWQGFAGTPAYTNPEALHLVSPTASAELFSVASVLYHAITGKPPFGDADMQEVSVRMQTQDREPLPEHVPADLRRIVEGALQYEAAEREFRSAEEMKQVIIGSGEPIATPREMGNLASRAMHLGKEQWLAAIREAAHPDMSGTWGPPAASGKRLPFARKRSGTARLALALLIALAVLALAVPSARDRLLGQWSRGQPPQRERAAHDRQSSRAEITGPGLPDAVVHGETRGGVQTPPGQDPDGVQTPSPRRKRKAPARQAADGGFTRLGETRESGWSIPPDKLPATSDP